MKIKSVNVGQPREVGYNGETVSTGIYKTPVAGSVPVHTLNLAGDGQADLKAHGGPTKAVYGYPAEHYEFWRGELPGMELAWGMFGENLTTVGLDETSVRIGDRFRFGTAELIVTEPRLPCYKLGIRFGRKDIIKRFLQSGRTGFYFSVGREGEVAAGDGIELLERETDSLSIADIVRLVSRDKGDIEMLRRAVALAALPEPWREHFRDKLAKETG